MNRTRLPVGEQTLSNGVLDFVRKYSARVLSLGALNDLQYVGMAGALIAPPSKPGSAPLKRRPTASDSLQAVASATFSGAILS